MSAVVVMRGSFEGTEEDQAEGAVSDESFAAPAPAAEAAPALAAQEATMTPGAASEYCGRGLPASPSTLASVDKETARAGRGHSAA